MSEGSGPLSNGGAFVVDYPFFKLLVDMEIQKAQRLRYPISLVAMEMETPPTEPSSDSLVRIIAPWVRATDAVAPRNAVSVVLLLIDAAVDSLATILGRLTTDLETAPWFAGGASYPETASTADQLLDPIDRWQAKVKENGVGPVALEMAQPFLTGMGDGRLVALVGECARKQFGDQDVILDEKQLDWAPSLPPADIP